MRKFKLMFDKDKEIEWLNAMCQNGWALKRFKYGLYTFEPCVPGEYVFDTDLNDNVLTLSSGYRELLKEMDIEFLCCSGFWFLVRRKASYGPLELYTDYESKIGQYRKIRNMFKAVAILELLVMYMQLYAYWMDRDWIFLAAAVVLFLMFFTLLRGAIAMNERVEQLNAASQGGTWRKTKKDRCLLVIVLGMLITSVGVLDIFPYPFNELLSGAGFGIELGALFVLLRTKNKFSASE